MWLTIKLQRDNPGETVPPIDIGCFARRYVIHNIEGLEKRVISDQGEDSVQLVRRCLGTHIKFTYVDCDFTQEVGFANFEELKEGKERELNCYLENQVGLVRSFGLCLMGWSIR